MFIIIIIIISYIYISIIIKTVKLINSLWILVVFFTRQTMYIKEISCLPFYIGVHYVDNMAYILSKYKI